MCQPLLTISRNVVNATLGSIKTNFEWIIGEVLSNVSSNYHFATVIVCIIIVLLLYFGSKSLESRNDKIRCYICIILAICCEIAFLTWHLRIVFFGLLLFGLATCICIPLARRIGSSSIDKDPLFVLILLGTSAIYALFVSLAKLITSRYNSYGFILFAFALVFIIDRLVKLFNDRDSQLMKFIMLLTCIVCCLYPFITKDIEYVYYEDRPIISRIKESDTDCSVIYTEGELNLEETYDCIYLLDEDSKLLVINDMSFDLSSKDVSNSFLLWAYNQNDITPLIDNIKSMGYSVELFGTTHESQVYECNL